MSAQELLTIGQAAKLLGVSTKTLRRWEAAGKLVPQRTGGNQRRYSKVDIEDSIPQGDALQGSPASQREGGGSWQLFSNSIKPSQNVSNTSEKSFSFKKGDFDFFFGNLDKFRKGVVYGSLGLLMVSATAVLGVKSNVIPIPGITDKVLSEQLQKLIPKKAGSPAQAGLSDTSIESRVLAAQDSDAPFKFNINIPAIFRDETDFLQPVLFESDVEIRGTVVSDNLLTALTAGDGISITTGTSPTITNNAAVFQNVSVSGQTTVAAGSLTDTLEFVAGDNVTITTDATNKKITIKSTDTTGSDGATVAFKTISVSGQSDVVANTSTDTLTLVAGTGISITNTASSDTITIAATSTLFTDGGTITYLTDVDEDFALGGTTSSAPLFFDTSAQTLTIANLTVTGAVTGSGGTTDSGGGTFGNIQIGVTGANEIDTSSGNLTIDSAGGTVTVDDNLTVAGVFTANGNIQFGNAASDTITFTSVVASTILPDANGTRNFGSSSTRWATGYFTTLDATNITGTITGDGTSAASWNVNNDNATNNAELSSLVFDTGTANFNAVVQWNASGDANRQTGYDNNFLFNFPISIFSQVADANQTFTSGSLINYGQSATHAITQSAAFVGVDIDLSSNITVPNSASGNQTGMVVTLKNGGASATSIGYQTAGTLDYGLDIGGTIGTAEIRLSNGETIFNTTDGTIALGATTLSLVGTTGITTDQTTLNIDVGNTGTIAFRDGTNSLLSVVDQGAYAFVRWSGKSDTGDPVNCTAGDIYFNTTDGTFKGCTATDSWADFGAIGSDTVWTSTAGVINYATATDRLQLNVGEVADIGLELVGIASQTANMVDISARNVSGTLVNADYGTASTQTGALTGLALDLSTNVTNTDQNQTGIALTIKDGSSSGTATGMSISGTVDYGIDLNGITTVGTADIRLANGETISNATDGTIALATTNLDMTTNGTTVRAKDVAPGDAQLGSNVFAYRRTVTLTNNTGNNLDITATTDYTFTLYLSGSTATNILNHAQSDCDDLRVAYNGSEINRAIDKCADGEIFVRFGIQADIANTASDANYILYYGNESLSAPTAYSGSTTIADADDDETWTSSDTDLVVVADDTTNYTQTDDAGVASGSKKLTSGGSDVGTFSTTNQAQLKEILRDGAYTSATIGGTTYIYAIGGLGVGDATRSTVYKAQLDTTDGDVGTFDTTSQAQLLEINSRGDAFTYLDAGNDTDYIYYLGGNGVSIHSGVYRATLDSSGNVGTFATTSQAQLPVHGCHITGDLATVGGTTYVYAIGGSQDTCGDTAALSAVYKAQIDPADGDVGTFATTSQAQLLEKLHGHSTITYSTGGTSYIYVLGGVNSAGTRRSTVYKSTLDTSADAGTFATTSQGQLIVDTSEKGFAVSSSFGGTTYIYYMGGVGASFQSTVMKAAIDGSQNVGTFATTSQAQLPVAPWRFGALTAEVAGVNYLYVLGGRDGAGNNFSTVYKAEIGSSPSGVTVTRTLGASLDLSNRDLITAWIRASGTGAASSIVFEIHDSGGTWSTLTALAMASANTWQQQFFDVRDVTVAEANKDVVDQVRFRYTGNFVGTFNFDQILSEVLYFDGSASSNLTASVAASTAYTNSLNINSEGAGTVAVNYNSGSKGGFAVYDGGTSTKMFDVTTLGNIIAGKQAALATSATDGFLYTPTSAGRPTGTPSSYTGKVALEYDTTNDKLCVFNSSWKCSGALSDIAEWMPAKGASIGDIVSLTDDVNPINDPTAPFMLGKSQKPYDARIVGVVSKFAEESNIAQGYRESSDYHAIALVGRVPVKVSTENGPIKKGDNLTSSSIPGVAMKATQSGPTIGMALQGYNPEGFDRPAEDGFGRVLVYVNPGWYQPSTADLSAPLLSADALEVNTAQVNEDLTVLGKTTLNEVGLTGDLTIGMISVQSDNSSINSLVTLKFQTNFGDGVQIDPLGNMIVAGDLTVLGKTTTNDIALPKNIGEVTIPAGFDSVEVDNPNVKLESAIFLSLSDSAGSASYPYIEDIQHQKFTIRLPSPPQTAIKVKYLIVNQ